MSAAAQEPARGGPAREPPAVRHAAAAGAARVALPPRLPRRGGRALRRAPARPRHRQRAQGALQELPVRTHLLVYIYTYLQN